MAILNVSYDRAQEAPLSLKTSGSNIRYFFAAVFAFLLTLLIDPLYTGGDPSLYRYVYGALATENLRHGFFFYSVILSSTEPLYYLLVWSLSHLGIPREIFIGTSSAILAFLSVKILVQRGANIILATVIVSTSFYFILLFTTTERLKIAVIFLIASVLMINRPRIAIVFAFLAVSAHIQVAILYLSFATIYVTAELRNAIVSKSLSVRLIGTTVAVFIFSLAAYYVIGNQIASKAGSYIGLGETSDLVRVLPLFLMTLWYSKDRINALLLFLPIIALTPIVGYGRLNIFSYFILLYFCVEKRRGFNIAVLMTTVYFAYSSYAFISRIREFGEPLLVGQ